MDLIFHPASVRDARGIAAKYSKISGELEARFWEEFDAAVEAIASHPERHHYDPFGMRRFNLKKFPYHILFEERLDCVRIIVVRHHHRQKR